MENKVNKASRHLFPFVIACVLASLLLLGCAWEQANEYPTCTIVIEVLPSGAGTVIGAGEYPVGTTVTLKALPNAGYSFNRWGDNERRASREVFMIKTEQTYTAYFD